MATTKDDGELVKTLVMSSKSIIVQSFVLLRNKVWTMMNLELTTNVFTNSREFCGFGVIPDLKDDHHL